ncbi:hypothetical protein LEP1GSC034_4560 [Leptospira interrogans str. 2003000735]|uniref:Uncharacterized protein n=12 Tax=Leptospira interrogans TaxID=173 RepID=A0A0E2DCS6_LEPIR|nr:hypothetical protein G436_3318 [Leptospira interrogans serovar Hardjo str. Norma]EJO77012.1 hypothetical protein LEP1GSC045_1959 [Leptospira interrogans serovar Pomona str. Kennewicki LC82-25]EJP04927.1 hypothetical protein LEP1GSC007_2852 [Leptospira interrogans serovar Bulgarica str. Mallika]EJP17884.1 hypothetical protein LEP1GSC080_0129 [Leptospira interrogans str. FPW2026]EKN89331.1 hypothetical protein LEP1GSC027_2399 [Leptospira interrogans str. 2002000624]EKN95596.1 hypothetical pro
MSKILSLKRNSYYLFNVISVEEEFSKNTYLYNFRVCL